MKALVTDAAWVHTLGIVRDLGKRKIEVYALGDYGMHGLNLSFHSRYCKEGIVGPSPKEDEYVDFLAKTLKNRDVDILIPVGYWSAEKIAGNRAKLDALTHIELAKVENIRLAANKKRTYELAEDLGIPFPKAEYPHSFDVVEKISRKVRYPVVVKPINEGYQERLFPSNSKELFDGYREMCRRNSFREDSFPMIQEYIPADSTLSFSALYQNGECKRVFMWEEIRSMPPEGGTSTYSESIYDPKVREYGMRLLDELDWHGVANIEFKRDKRDGQLKLMEINPKFWASVEIAIQSGIDFPYLLCEMARGVQLEYSENYDRHVKFHWLSREIRHITQMPSSIPRVMIDTLSPSVKSNIEPSDMKPHILEFTLPIAAWMLSALRRPRSRTQMINV